MKMLQILDREAVIAAIEAGEKSPAEIAEEYGVSPGYVQRIYARSGDRTPITPEVIERVKALYEGGVSQIGIRRETGLSQQRLGQVFDQLGIKRRTPGPERVHPAPTGIRVDGVVVSERYCKRCDETKPLSEFYFRPSVRADGEIRYIPLSFCRSCRMKLPSQVKTKH
jgi:hypothetical protein